MKQCIRLGRASDNDQIYPSQDISSHHAVIKRLDDRTFEVEDLNSVNGTYINGVRIKRCKFTLADQLRLSATTLVDIASLFEKSTPSPKEQLNFVREFAALREPYERYEAQKLAIQRRFQKKVLIIRGALVLGPIGLLTLIKGDALGAGVGMALGIAASFFTVNMSPAKELKELEERFKPTFICPNDKCRNLHSWSWNMLYNHGFCPRCNAIYNEKMLNNHHK